MRGHPESREDELTALMRWPRDPKRALIAALLALAVTPGLWWRPQEAHNFSAYLAFKALPDVAAQTGAIRLRGVWQLMSHDTRFGGYSALVLRPDGRLRSYSDEGNWLEFSPPGRMVRSAPSFGTERPGSDKLANDVEAAAFDPGRGQTWLALEGSNTIRRFTTDPSSWVEVAPKAMARFPENRGAEAMVRLGDGRFIVLREAGGRRDWRRHRALLFARDPIEDPSATPFSISLPAGFDPSDAALLPDGRVLILLRKLSLSGFPPFASRLVVADPADIRAGEDWPWRPVADISAIAPRENYEGLAVVPAKGGVTLWLISDSNDAVFLQRTLLLELHWNQEDAVRTAKGPPGE